MSAETLGGRDAGASIARWSIKAWLVVAAFFLVGGAIWYARSATIPLIVAALVSTQLLPLITLAINKGLPRGLAITFSLLLVLAVAIGLAYIFTDALFGNLGGVGANVSEGADKVVNWLKDNNDWVRQHEDGVRSFLKGILPAAKDAASGIFTA